MSLSNAIKNKDMVELDKTVKEATKIYAAAKPESVSIDTVHGQLPLNAIFDEDTKWAVITAAYAEIIQAVSKIPATADAVVETAKLIATNAVLRNINEPTSTKGGLL